MSKKILQIIVIILSIFIFFAFIAVIYGLYLKISKNPKNIDLYEKKISLKLSDNQEISEIKVIDENNLLIVIKELGRTKGIIYNIDNDKVSKIIEK
tara:strand:+ start:77 stop:364 length:288 start_codon:yes stop_codon:yes gene_type:complete